MLSSSKSVIFSSILLKVVFVGLCAAVFLIPFAVKWAYPVLSEQTSIFILLCADLYLLLTAGFVAVIKLNSLLENLKKDKVFVSANINCLRAISYSCFAAGIAMFTLGFFLPLSYLVAVVALFLGLILRIVRYVFTAAVELREENDTVI